MSDRELLELAAKAAGVKYWVVRLAPRSAPVEKLHVEKDGETVEWNPLADDGDALRLAVKLEIQVGYSEFSGEAVATFDRGFRSVREYGPDAPEEATRRAIVRAAAEIGRTM